MTTAPNVEEKIFLARVAEQAERFEDMVDFLEEVLAAKGGSVNPDERNLLSVAFKNLISSKRAACRTISAIEQNPKYAKFNGALLTYKGNIETQLANDCQKIIDMINNRVLNTDCADEAKAFFIKMVGDYYRYIAENAKDSKLEEVKNKAAAPLFMFGNLKTDTKPQEVADVDVEPPQWLKDIMITSQPLATAFAFYRYYLLQPKYKAIVKFDLDHPAYFKKRDKGI